ncbi:MAG: sulfite exporter TauE/SafE family protein [Burkholderiales bacterium]
MDFALLYALTGAFVGLLAGLLGVGGGLVIVPVLSLAFAAQHFPDGHILHLAIGTSLASILFTSLSSLRAHHSHGAVDWRIVGVITPGIVLGTLAGSLLASHLSTPFLKGFFVCFELYVGTQMLLNLRPKPSRQLPSSPGMLAAGGVIGGVSSLVGIGGGTLSVPFMTWCNISMHRAIGTSAAIGFPIALAGTAAYIASGLKVADLPAASVGFLYLPALAGLAAASMLTAPFGARLAHRLPVAKLKKAFAFLLYVLAIRMASDLL